MTSNETLKLFADQIARELGNITTERSGIFQSQNVTVKITVRPSGWPGDSLSPSELAIMDLFADAAGPLNTYEVHRAVCGRGQKYSLGTIQKSLARLAADELLHNARDRSGYVAAYPRAPISEKAKTMTQSTEKKNEGTPAQELAHFASPVSPSPHPLMKGELPPFVLSGALTLVDVGRLIRAPMGGRLNTAVVWRWASRGYTCRGWTGPSLVLPTVVLGKRRYTMMSWLEMFEAARVTMGQRCAAPIRPIKQRTQRQASKAHQRAVASLEKAGYVVG